MRRGSVWPNSQTTLLMSEMGLGRVKTRRRSDEVEQIIRQGSFKCHRFTSLFDFESISGKPFSARFKFLRFYATRVKGGCQTNPAACLVYPKETVAAYPIS